jgi:predicted TIM-barrel fold metal-dependent hydrolase
MDMFSHQGIADELLSRLTHLPVIDTHEHMMTEAEFVAGEWDFTHLMSYAGLDLGLAGMPHGPWGGAQFAICAGETVQEKWQRIKPHWPHVRTGAYARSYRRLLRRFFGVDDLTDETALSVSSRIAEYQQAGVYRTHLQEQYGIRVMLRPDGFGPTPEPQHFGKVIYLDGVAGAWSREELRVGLGVEPPASFGEFRELFGRRIAETVANGAVGMKIGGTARRRPVDFDAHSPERVEKSYAFLIGASSGDWLSPGIAAGVKPFQDAAYWAAFELAGEHGLPVQVHSGLEFMQPWDGRPSALIPSLIRFPQTKFAVFHGSYPYMDELTGLAKSFANVYLDLAWFHLLSQVQARAWLAEWLDVLPHNKLFAFGGDVFLFFEACSHLELARENVAAVLAERVERGLCDLDEAEHTARLLFHDNPWSTFGMANWERVSA